MFSSRSSSRPRGSTLLLSLSCIAGLAIMAALTLQRISPRFQMASQAAAWQEAKPEAIDNDRERKILDLVAATKSASAQ